MTTRSSRSVRSRLSLLAGGLSLALVAGCSGSPASDEAEEPRGVDTSQVSKDSVAKISANIAKGARNVALGRKVRLTVDAGTFEDVNVTGPRGIQVKGQLSQDKTKWVSTTNLQQASRYRIVGSAVDDEGRATAYEAGFRTKALSLDEQTYPSFLPSDGATVGVGMPVIIRFDVPVTDQASIEKHLSVVSKPAQAGSFHWLNNQEVHWRPRNYWRPGTDVTVNANIAGVPAGDGIYGQKNRRTTFKVGRAMVSKVNMDTHTMKVFENGKLLRTIPITTGEQPKFTTRSGTKVIIEKYRYKRMNSETIGIDPESDDGYDLDNVEYAMRVTYSGEFVHAAPWSVGSQGSANVSHGCTGMSTSNAGWFYERSIMGDVIRYTGTDKPTDISNGFGDWNVSFDDYRTGSALS